MMNCLTKLNVHYEHIFNLRQKKSCGMESNTPNSQNTGASQSTANAHHLNIHNCLPIESLPGTSTPDPDPTPITYYVH